MYLEMWGHKINVPEPVEAGTCKSCDERMYDYEVSQCGCGARVHDKCRCKCDACGHAGCAVCMMEKDGLMFCNDECERKYYDGNN